MAQDQVILDEVTHAKSISVLLGQLTFPSHSLSLKARHSHVDQKLVAKCWLTYYTIHKFGEIEVVEGVMDMEDVDGEEEEEDDEIY